MYTIYKNYITLSVSLYGKMNSKVKMTEKSVETLIKVFVESLWNFLSFLLLLLYFSPYKFT